MGKSTWIALLLMPLCVGVATAQPITTRPSAKVIDPAHVFSAEAVDRAARLIDQISERHHKDVLVLAYLTIPMDKAADFQAKSRDQFFADWSAQLAREHQLNGMLVVVIKQMGRLEITVGNQTLQHQFTTADRDKLRDLMLEHFKEHRFDQGLVQGLQFVLQRMWENQQGQQEKQS